MSSRYILIVLIAFGCIGGALAEGATPPAQSFGVVNFGACVSDSKLGKQEQASFETLKKQMTSLLEETEKQLNEINTQFNDPEYLDGLSQEAESELGMKFEHLKEELSRYQNQYYQVLNQANMRIYQIMSVQINSAAEKVAKDKNLLMVINKEACFSYAPQLDVTNLIISEIDKTFDEEASKQAAVQGEKSENLSQKDEESLSTQ
jgi:outer membrane protein